MLILSHSLSTDVLKFYACLLHRFIFIANFCYESQCIACITVSRCRNFLWHYWDIFHWDSQYNRSNIFYNIAYSKNPRICFWVLIYRCSIFCLFGKLCFSFLLICFSEEKHAWSGRVYFSIVAFWSLKINRPFRVNCEISILC